MKKTSIVTVSVLVLILGGAIYFVLSNKIVNEEPQGVTTPYVETVTGAVPANPNAKESGANPSAVESDPPISAQN